MGEHEDLELKQKRIKLITFISQLVEAEILFSLILNTVQEVFKDRAV